MVMAAIRLLTFVQIVLHLVGVNSALSTECAKRHFNDSSFVCVCNATYCDEIEPVDKQPPSQYLIYTSSKDGARLQKSSHSFVPAVKQCGKKDVNAACTLNDECVTLTLNRKKVKQTIFGFGGAFTDATGQNILSLSNATQNRLLDAYFSKSGIEYSLCRVPIGGSDFSPRMYSYDDDHANDFNLTSFRLAPEDFRYKIPIIQRAISVARHPVKLFGSPWSPPGWMKTGEGRINSPGSLQLKYYQTWANYFVRFLDEYKLNKIDFWGLTVQNEAEIGCSVQVHPFNCMTYTPATQRTFVQKNLGPTLVKKGYGDVQLMIVDDQRTQLPAWPREIIGNASNFNDYVDGIAFHWYMNDQVGPEVLDQTHEEFPNHFLLSAEACEGFKDLKEFRVRLGSWERGENYASDIMEDLQHWTVGWVDWNMALNMSGGVNWINNLVDSPVIVNSKADEFYKQPMFYALGHFSKFVAPGSKVIGLSGSDERLHAIAFENAKDGSTIIVVINKSDSPVQLLIKDSDTAFIEQQMAARSIQTYIYWR